MLAYKWGEEIQIVKGYNRICLYDLPRLDYSFAPKEIDQFIESFNSKLVNVSESFDSVQLSWFNYFLDQEYIFKIPEKLCYNFVSLNISEWEHPSILMNAILHENILDKSLMFIDELVCKQVLVICKDENSIGEILEEYFSITNFQRVDFFLTSPVNLERVAILHESYPILGEVYSNNGFGDNKDKNINVSESPFLNVSLEIYSESQKHNVYFNRKIYINQHGHIKNATESDVIFGKINEILNINEFEKIIHSNEFQGYWFVNKDLIDACKDCELRNMCVDNRIPYQRSENEWYHKIECKYNPYISKWSHEDGFRTLSECGVISNENKFSIDHNRIAEINKEIWEEE
jgi:hypothetical protein